MDVTACLMLAIFILGGGSLCLFFKTKTKGFGRYTTSTLLIMLVLIITALLFSGGKLDAQVMANVIFAIFGFASGLFTSRDSN